MEHEINENEIYTQIDHFINSKIKEYTPAIHELKKREIKKAKDKNHALCLLEIFGLALIEAAAECFYQCKINNIDSVHYPVLIKEAHRLLDLRLKELESISSTNQS